MSNSSLGRQQVFIFVVSITGWLLVCQAWTKCEEHKAKGT